MQKHSEHSDTLRILVSSLPSEDDNWRRSFGVSCMMWRSRWGNWDEPWNLWQKQAYCIILTPNSRFIRCWLVMLCVESWHFFAKSLQRVRAKDFLFVMMPRAALCCRLYRGRSPPCRRSWKNRFFAYLMYDIIIFSRFYFALSFEKCIFAAQKLIEKCSFKAL